MSHALKIFLCFLVAQAVSGKGVNVGFVINYLAVTGLEGSTYDYADFNETLLDNMSYMIFVPESSYASYYAPVADLVRKKIVERFGDRYHECTTRGELDALIERLGIDVLYLQRGGGFERLVSKKCKNAVHATFLGVPIHGDAYAVISKWMGQQYLMGTMPYVPYIVRQLPDTTDNLRQILEIPQEAIVFGRHGGVYGFDIPFVKDVIVEVARAHKNIYFLFMNTDKFSDLPNIIFLGPTPDLEYKAKFINTCDAMIHARARGETFGLACAEFSIKNKPVITWARSPERSHIDILGKKGIYYTNRQDLLNILTTFTSDPVKDWDAYSQEYSPAVVMKKFDRIFIQPLMK